MNNQIDLGKIYGIKGITDASGLEPANFISSPSIPSLEQIAEYNLASRGIDVTQNNNLPNGVSAPSLLDYPTGVPYDADYNLNIPLENQQTINTPTTTLNSALANNTQEDINTLSSTTITDFSNPLPVTPESIQYLNGFIRTQIGRRITVTFLVGSNLIEEKTGFLLGVGANYILINELDTNDLTACDFYNIKFIRFYY